MKYLLFIVFISILYSVNAQNEYYVKNNGEKIACKIKKHFIGSIKIDVGKESDEKEGLLKADEVMAYQKDGIYVERKSVFDGKDTAIYLLPNDRSFYKYSGSYAGVTNTSPTILSRIQKNNVDIYYLQVPQSQGMGTYFGLVGAIVDVATRPKKIGADPGNYLILKSGNLGYKQAMLATILGDKRVEVWKLLAEYLDNDALLKEKMVQKYQKGERATLKNVQNALGENFPMKD